MLDVELSRLTVGDLWTVIQPKMITTGELDKIKMEVPAFKPGWLTDTVCIFALQKRIPIIYDLKFTYRRFAGMCCNLFGTIGFGTARTSPCVVYSVKLTTNIFVI